MSEIIKKLNIGQYEKKLILHKPDDIRDFEGISFDTEIHQSKYNLIFVFVFSLDDFLDYLKIVIRQDLLNPGGFLYFAYPKKGNKKYKEFIGRDDFFAVVEMDQDGYVNGSFVKFAKMVAFNDIFTVIGMKHQEKRKDKSLQPSQCVADYIERIPDLQKHFAASKEALGLFNSLTPGYQRDWSRYVFSAQTETTLQKRLLDMEDILKQGYKSKDLYRQRKNKI